MSVDFVAHLGEALRGRACTVTRREHYWAFDFGGDCGISRSTPWRIVDLTGIRFADADNGQLFGLTEQVNGQKRSNELLKRLHVEAVELDQLTADLRLRFTNGTRVELFNNSSGYEGWQADFPFYGRVASIIGLGGGDLAFFER